VLIGFDDDLPARPLASPTGSAACSPASILLSQRAIGPRISHPAVLEVLSRCGGPAGIAKACCRKLTAIAKVRAPRRGDKLIDAIMIALSEQTVVVPGSAAADVVLPRLADSLKTVLQQRKQVAEQVEGILDAHPLAEVLTSMPGIGVRTEARILLEIGEASNFASSGHLAAAYAGIAPVTRSSGSSIRGEHPARTGNCKLERAFFLAAFAALHDTASRTYYDRKRAEGKKHNAALICLARRRCDVLYAMLATAPTTANPNQLRPPQRLDNHIGTPATYASVLRSTQRATVDHSSRQRSGSNLLRRHP
jgi:hypothetical protein